MGLTTPKMLARMTDEERMERNRHAIAVLDSFTTDYDPDEIAETFDIIARGIDSHRPEGYKLFDDYL